MRACTVRRRRRRLQFAKMLVMVWIWSMDGVWMLDSDLYGSSSTVRDGGIRIRYYREITLTARRIG